MKVRAIKEHRNVFGAKHRKEVGAEYDVPDGPARKLMALGLIVAASDKPEIHGKKKDELVAIAAAEGVDVGDKDTKAEIVAKIAAARSVPPVDESEAE